MKAIIFGMNGQDGYYLKSILARENIEVVGVSRSKGDNLIGDVADFAEVKEIINKHKPHFIFHLAANSTTRHNVLFENHETISTGTLNILESVYQTSQSTKVFISGSALQFVNNCQPISESDPFEAGSPYAIARIQSAYAARYYRRLGIQTYVGYFFHHDSPRRPERHLNMKIAQAALKVGEGKKNSIEIGNIDVVKEYNFAGDMMEAIWTLVNQNSFFESVIGSGKGYSIREWIEICFENVGKDWRNYVKTNALFEPEFMSLISNPTTILSTGWRPKMDINSLAASMMGSRL